MEDIDRAMRQNVPLVSILILTHNSSAFIRPCLESILRNTSYPSYEVIVVDNASTRRFRGRAQEYVDRDSRFRLFALAENLGFAGGNNHAVRQSRGEYSIFLNIDTMVTRGWVGRAAATFPPGPFHRPAVPGDQFRRQRSQNQRALYQLARNGKVLPRAGRAAKAASESRSAWRRCTAR